MCARIVTLWVHFLNYWCFAFSLYDFNVSTTCLAKLCCYFHFFHLVKLISLRSLVWSTGNPRHLQALFFWKNPLKAKNCSTWSKGLIGKIRLWGNRHVHDRKQNTDSCWLLWERCWCSWLWNCHSNQKKWSVWWRGRLITYTYLLTYLLHGAESFLSS